MKTCEKEDCYCDKCITRRALERRAHDERKVQADEHIERRGGSLDSNVQGGKKYRDLGSLT